MLQLREIMNVKKSIYLHIYSTFIKKNIYSKNIHNQEHYNSYHSFGIMGSSFEDFSVYLKTSQQIGTSTHFLPCIYLITPHRS